MGQRSATPWIPALVTALPAYGGTGGVVRLAGDGELYEDLGGGPNWRRVRSGDVLKAGSNTFTGVNQFALGLSLRNALGAYNTTFSTAGALGSEWSNGTATYANGSVNVMVSGGVATNSAGAGSSDAFAYLNTGTAMDGAVQGDLTVGGALMMRHNGAGSGYQLLFYAGNSVIFIRQTSGQGDVQLYQSATGQAAGTYRVVMVGNTFALYQGATLMTTVTDSTYAAGYVGVYLQNTGGNSVDNFVWTPAPAPVGYTLLSLEGGVGRLRDSSGNPVSFVGNASSVAVNFGDPAVPDFYQEVTVSTPWLTPSSVPFATLSPGSSGDHTATDILLEQLETLVLSSTPGVSVVVGVAAPNGTWGRYLVTVTG